MSDPLERIAEALERLSPQKRKRIVRQTRPRTLLDDIRASDREARRPIRTKRHGWFSEALEP